MLGPTWGGLDHLGSSQQSPPWCALGAKLSVLLPKTDLWGARAVGVPVSPPSRGRRWLAGGPPPGAVRCGGVGGRARGGRCRSVRPTAAGSGRSAGRCGAVRGAVAEAAERHAGWLSGAGRLQLSPGKDGLQFQRHREAGLRAHPEPAAGGECRPPPGLAPRHLPSGLYLFLLLLVCLFFFFLPLLCPPLFAN